MILSSRQKELILWMCGVFTTVALLLLIAFPLERASTKREPASSPVFESKKMEILKGDSDSHLQGKGSGSLQVVIRNHGKSTMMTGSTAELQATVKALSDLSDLEYKWLIPDGITAETGSIQGSIGRLSQGEQTTLNLTIMSHVSDNRQVHLHVYRKVGDESLGEIAQFNTILQEKIESDIEKRAEVLKAQANPTKELEDDDSHHLRGLVQ